MLKRVPHCEVHIFDPTLDENQCRYVEAIKGVQFHSYGLGPNDVRVSMGSWYSHNKLCVVNCQSDAAAMPLAKSCWSDCSTLQVSLDSSRQWGRGTEHVELRSLHTIMSDLGHRWIDVLKIDIEGAEWRALEGLVAKQAPLPFTQLQV